MCESATRWLAVWGWGGEARAGCGWESGGSGWERQRRGREEVRTWEGSCAPRQARQLPVTVAWAMAGDDEECLEPVSFFWTRGWSRRGWMAFLFLFLPFIFSRLERRVAVATTRRRAPHTCTTNASSRQPGPRLSPGRFSAVGNTTARVREREREVEGGGEGNREAEKEENTLPVHAMTALLFNNGGWDAQDRQVVAQKPCPGSQRGCSGVTGSGETVTHDPRPPTAHAMEEGNHENRQSFKASTLTKSPGRCLQGKLLCDYPELKAICHFSCGTDFLTQRSAF